MIFIGHYAMLTRCIGTVMHLKCDNEAKALFFFPKCVSFFFLLDDAHVCRANPLAETFTLHKLTLSNTSFSRSCPLPPPTLQSSQRGSRFQVSCCCTACFCMPEQKHEILVTSFPLFHKLPLFLLSPLLSSVSLIWLFLKLHQVVLWQDCPPGL